MQLLARPGFLRLLRLSFWAALLFAVTMAVLPHPPDFGTNQMGDKFNHMLAFAVLSALAALSFPRADLWRLAERLSFVGALIEVVQALPMLGRDCDIRDWIADTLSIVVVMAVMRTILPRLRGAETASEGP